MDFCFVLFRVDVAEWKENKNGREIEWQKYRTSKENVRLKICFFHCKSHWAWQHRLMWKSIFFPIFIRHMMSMLVFFHTNCTLYSSECMLQNISPNYCITYESKSRAIWITMKIVQRFIKAKKKHHSTVNFHHFVVVSPGFRSHCTMKITHRSHCGKSKYKQRIQMKKLLFFHHYLIHRPLRPGKREEIEWCTCKD